MLVFKQQTKDLRDNNKEKLVFWAWNTSNTLENKEQNSNTISDIPSINKQKHSNQNEPPTSENRNTTQPNNTEQTLTQKQKVNLENVKRIINREKNTLLSPWLTLKPLVQTTSLFTQVKKGHILLRLEPWPQCSKKISYRA